MPFRPPLQSMAEISAKFYFALPTASCHGHMAAIDKPKESKKSYYDSKSTAAKGGARDELKSKSDYQMEATLLDQDGEQDQ
ncbi:hypothetical protein Ahy_A09g045268 [Arachis hypogaea]|uniref:Uncharacterized protein n=1 Tax=Arachis hypogaea TaxID=3818 RepID=A0A445BLZ3_ARAHY|nr:hypothetical protein Ahy_A09g045268 [Arachis hypogaea]